jgi:putative phosphoserine phosphatase/1-acylglycerol-3-phosphate O-acyltransferase
MNPLLDIYSETVAGILEGERGPHIGAFFDFDGTLISGYSVVPFLWEQLYDGLLMPRDVSEAAKAALALKAGAATYADLMEDAALKLRGIKEQTFVRYGKDAYEAKVARMIYPESRALILAHLHMGHTVAIVSSATPYQVEPALMDLQVEHLECTHFEVDRGYFTGQLDGEVCFGIGKVNAVNRLCDEFGAELQKSYFYSDSYDDIEVLEHVGRPQVLNPSDKLRGIAETRGWPIRSFESRGSRKAKNVARNIAAVSSFVPTALTGAAMWWLTGSKTEGRNFIISTFSDLATALMGLRIDVRGSNHLWSHRPAVVIFNHQSNIDPIVLSKLMRRDAAAVGKKELSELPIIGPIFDFLGMIPIDRSNTVAAVQALEPLAELMHQEQRSVVIAPEGTRSLSAHPGRFKKGPFRIAMAAGVPIVPVVIHNASDAQPKGELFARPATIAVDVLEPIDVSDWTLDDLEERIESVRDLYLEVLDQHDITLDGGTRPKSAAGRDADVIDLYRERKDRSRNPQ